MTDLPSENTEAYRALCYGDSVFRERYEGWHELGHGGHAVVVRVLSRVLGKDIALKIFTPLASDDRPRFQREANNAAEVSSPFIVRPMGVFVRGSLGWIEMELVDGPDLARELERRQAARDPFPLVESLDIAVDVTTGLVHAHEASLIHRDIKPANIYLPRSRRPAAKLGDFGIARLAESMKLTKTDVFRGTPEWTSPEGADGRALEAPHDVYCLGLTLFSLFTNNGKAIPIPPGASSQAVLRAHVKQQPRSARSLNPEVPKPLEALLARCLLKRPPEKRPSAAELLRSLSDIRDHARRRRTPSTPVAVGSVWRQRLRWAAILACGLLGLWAAWFSLSRTKRPGREAAAIQAPSLAAALGTQGSPTPPAATPLRATVQGRFLRLSTSGDTLRDVRLTLVGAKRSYEQGLAEPLDAGSAAFLSLDDFAPVPDTNEVLRELRVEAVTPSGPLRLTLPLVR